jgi:hypothetical protein
VSLYNFSGDKAKGQIDLVKNASIIVLQEHQGGWSTVEANGVRGYGENVCMFVCFPFFILFFISVVPTNYFKKN